MPTLRALARRGCTEAAPLNPGNVSAERIAEILAELLEHELSLTWTWHAACIDTDTTMFFPAAGHYSATEPALGLCRVCPVRRECLTEHLGEVHGIVGGTTAAERRAVRNHQRHMRGDACA